MKTDFSHVGTVRRLLFSGHFPLLLRNNMDHSWMKARRTTKEYEDGVESFLQFVQRNAFKRSDGLYFCPCVNCLNGTRLAIPDIREHLICDGINLRYTNWIWHGEIRTTPLSRNDEVVHDNFGDGISDMFRDIGAESSFPKFSPICENLLSDAETPLYPGSNKNEYTRLNFVLRLMNLKSRNGWTDSSFTELLELLSDAFPIGNTLPKSMYEAKKMLCPMGLSYKRIHACPNDCILYRNEYEGLNKCPKCGTSRYKVKKDGGDCDEMTKGSPLKVLWYLPVIPRFKRLFANATDAKNLRWHSDGRINDGLLRHPADSPQWKTIDEKFPEFGCEPRNLRLGLCTDGINPYGNLNSTHSAWPVLLVIYNLPPSLCMKRKYIMLSLMISGPKQPGNDIDVYLEPLIEDLKKLWEEGVDVFDAHKQETFKLRAMIFTTINDFPAYGNLSGYSVKGHKACPICEEGTNHVQLKHGRKTVYLSHRRFLSRHHPYRRLKKAFNGSQEYQMAPIPLTGDEVYERVQTIHVSLGKKNKKAIEKNIWKKRSIFFDLPYWRNLEVRHSLDVMHVEKNVCESLVGTLLHISGKSKDGVNARRDLVEMGIRAPLHPQQREGSKRVYLYPAAHTLSKQEKTSLCECLHGIKVPQGYSSNFKKLVSMQDLKITGMKSHDCHMLMQQLLPVAIRGSMKDDVRSTITRLCMFFNAVCSKVIDPAELDELENEGYVILSQLEMHFPPAFFDIMVHLIAHLVREIRLCGPVCLRWMYPFERYMKILKGYSKNPYRPEASIVERYVAEEVVEFCNAYLAGVRPVGLPQSRHDQGRKSKGTRGVKVKPMSREVVMQAHLYILNNKDEVLPYLETHKNMLKNMNPRKSDMQLANEHNKSFAEWFKQEVLNEDNPSETIQRLAAGPRFEVVCWEGYDINGYSYYTKAQDDKSTMQNSGVMVVAESMHFASSKDKKPTLASMPYYGVIEEIWEVSYSKFKVPVFKCKWVNNNAVHVDEKFGFVSVNLQRVGYRDDPFILASQAVQVFYVTDPANKDLSIVLQGKRQSPIGGDDSDLGFNLDETPPFTTTRPRNVEGDLIDDEYAIRDDHCEGIWVDTN